MFLALVFETFFVSEPVHTFFVWCYLRSLKVLTDFTAVTSEYCIR